MPFLDLHEHLAETFGQDIDAALHEGLERVLNRRRQSNRDYARHDRQRRQARPPTEARGLTSTEQGQRMETSTRIKPGRWTKVKGEWVKAL